MTAKKTAASLSAGVLLAGAAWFGIDAAAVGSTEAERWRSGWRGQSVDSVAAAEKAATTQRPGRTVIVTTRPTRGADVDLPPSGFSAGDFFVFEENVFNRSGSKQVGRDSVRCEVRVRTFSCEATILIRGSKIHIAGANFKRRDNTYVVTGGTGDYQGVGGTLTVFNLRGGRSVLAFHLVR